MLKMYVALDGLDILSIVIKRHARESISHEYGLKIKKHVTRNHCSASLGKPLDNSDPRDGFFYLHHILMTDSYNLIQVFLRW